MNFLTSSVVRAEESEDFAEIQLSHIRAFRDGAPDGRARVSQGLVVIPTDSAERRRSGRSTRRTWPARTPRTTTPQGPARMHVRAATWSARPREIAERPARARRLPGGRRGRVRAAVHLRRHDDYVQILTDIATRLGPALGWKPAG